MKRILLGVGAVTAAAYAAKKLIDKECEKEYLETLEREWEEEANFESPYVSDDLSDEEEEELEYIFANSENVDMDESLWDKLKITAKNVMNTLPKITITINVEDRNKNEEE